MEAKRGETLLFAPFHLPLRVAMNDRFVRCTLSGVLVLSFLLLQAEGLAQRIQITRAEVAGDQLHLEYELLNVPFYVEAEMEFSVRASNGSSDVVVRPSDKADGWARPNGVHVLDLVIPHAVMQRDAPNLHVTITPKAYRVIPAVPAAGGGLSALALGGWGMAGARFAQAGREANPDEAERLQSAAGALLVVGTVSGLVGGATIWSWKKWNDKLQSRRWSMRPITISLNRETSESVEVNRAVNLVGQPCVFDVGGTLPPAGSTLQLIVDRACTNCKSLSINESKWSAMLAGAYSITSRSKELEQTVLREQRLWLSDIVPETWSQQVGAISGADYTALLTCDCKSGAGVQLKFIDNRTGETLWTASGDACLSDQFFQEVRLVFHP